LSKKKSGLGKAIDRLEKIVQSLEREELELEAALGLFDEGMELIRAAEKELSESEGRLKQVLVDRSGRQRTADIEVETEEEEER
jgi:exodeoxyribonuclease VII small subunit